MAIILVTGGTGYLGSHIISQLLTSTSHIVRAVVRPQSVHKLKKIFPGTSYDLSRLQILEKEFLTSDWTATTQGVWGVIHCAAPAYFKDETKEMVFRGTYDATLGLAEAAIASGAKRIVVTGTTISLTDLNLTEAFGRSMLTPRSRPSISLADVNISNDSGKMLYRKAKALADQQLWQIQQQHPEVDITVMIAPVLFGPLLPTYPLPSQRRDLSTINAIYSLIAGGPRGPRTYPELPLGYMADVRDIAKAHILALNAPRIEEPKRLILSSKTFTWRELVDVIRRAFPHLEGRLPPLELEPPVVTSAPLDLSLGHKVLGWKGYIPWEESVLACVREGLAWEKANSA